MPYGLKVETSNGILQLDSSQVWEYGQVEVGTASSWVMQHDELLYIKLPTPAAGVRTGYHRVVTATSGTQETVMIVATGNNSTALNVDYAVVRPGSTFTPDGSQTYGLKMWNINNVTTFDSRSLGNLTYAPTNYYPAGSLLGFGSLSGDTANNNSFSRITTDFNDFISMNWSHFTSNGGGSSEIYSAVVCNNVTDANGTFDGTYYYARYFASPFSFLAGQPSDILIAEQF